MRTRSYGAYEVHATWAAVEEDHAPTVYAVNTLACDCVLAGLVGAAQFGRGVADRAGPTRRRHDDEEE